MHLGLLGADVQLPGVLQIQHLRADDRRIRRQIGESVEPQYGFGFQQDVVIHQDDVRVVGDARDLIKAARKSARTTEVRLPQIHQLVAQLRGDVLEQLTGLDGVGALIGDVDRVDARQQTLVARDGREVRRAVVGPVERADGDRGGPDRRRAPPPSIPGR